MRSEPDDDEDYDDGCDVCGEQGAAIEVHVEGQTFTVCDDECADALIEASEEPE